MSDCEYLGTLERDPDGTVRIRRPHIPPAPARTRRPIQIPLSVERQIDRGNVYVTTVIGDSMQPTILDNDVVVVSPSRSPRHRDIVVIRAHAPHPVYGPIDGYVWRYYACASERSLGKDNPHYRDRQPVLREEIVGVVTRILPRAYRDEHENYLRIQQHRALSQACKITDPPDLGFYRERDLRELRAIFQIPESELVHGRLPWGFFRATAITDHPHVGITTQDILTVEPTIESCTGQLVVKRNDDGETILGVLQRDGLRSRHPGEFFIETAERRINVSRDDGRYPLYRAIAVIKRIQRRGVVIRLPQWTASLTAEARPQAEQTTRVRGTGGRR
jgi:SOS-response transcriptional repressor LexA